MTDKEAKLSIELKEATGPNGEDLAFEATIQGSTPALLRAYHQLSLHLLQTLRDKYGKDLAMGMYAFAQTNALEEFGIDLKAQAEEAASEIMQKQERKKQRDALLSILGKTFTADGKEVTE